jgi:hypothetical protein
LSVRGHEKLLKDERETQSFFVGKETGREG